MAKHYSKTYRLLLPSIAGFLFYGSWAVFINHSHGWYMAIKAGLTQGSYSFCITLLLGVLVESLFVHLRHVAYRNFYVFTVATLVLAITSYSINYLTGTPEILWTILPGLVVSMVYTIIYILGLNKLGVSKP